MISTKTCSKCKQEKPFSEFNKGKDKFGLHVWCKECYSKWAAEHYKKNKDKRKKKTRKKMKNVVFVSLCRNMNVLKN